MATVRMYWESARDAFRLRWYGGDGSGQLLIRVYARHLNGDIDATERVARQLKDHIEAAVDKSDKVLFHEFLNDCVAAQLTSMEAMHNEAPVNMLWCEEQQKWDVSWDGGARFVSVYTASVRGDKAAAKRIAERLRGHVRIADDRSDPSEFWEYRDDRIAEELSVMDSHGSGAASSQPSHRMRDAVFGGAD